MLLFHSLEINWQGNQFHMLEYMTTVEFTLQDFGEPGRDDRMAILIYETANPGNVILDVPLQVMTGGNLQAHYDQPHK